MSGFIASCAKHPSFIADLSLILKMLALRPGAIPSIPCAKQSVPKKATGTGWAMSAVGVLVCRANQFTFARTSLKDRVKALSVVKVGPCHGIGRKYVMVSITD